MKKLYLRTFIKRELRKINQDIDMRILLGMEYRDQARRHRMLMQASRKLRKENLFARAFQLASMVLF